MKQIERFFPSDKKDRSYKLGHRWIQKQKKRGRIKKVGQIEVNGRSLNVYCTRQIPASLVKHDVGLGLFLDLFPGYQKATGGDVDQRFRADCEMLLPEHVFVEFDNDTERAPRLKQRCAVYDNVSSRVLWVTTSAHRKNQLMRLSTNRNFLFTTLDDVLTEGPAAAVWETLDGVYISLWSAGGEPTWL